MAAKKLQDYVKGKITSSNVGPIHFSPNGQQDKTIINISKFQQVVDDKITQAKPLELEIETSNFADQKLSNCLEIIENNSNTEIPSSNMSSPDSKQKWGSHITDVKKNINNAVEDVYSVLNTLVKDHISKPETKSYQSDSFLVENSSVIDQQPPFIRNSKTMSNIAKSMSTDDPGNETGTLNRSMDNLSLETEQIDSKKSKDMDSVDFTWLPTPKNIKTKKLKSSSRDNESNIPRTVQKSLIENYKFPPCKTVSSRESSVTIKWYIYVGPLLLIFAMILINLQIFFGFSIGLVTCLWFLNHFQYLNILKNHKVVSFPTLKELPSPSIPHIQKDNFEDRDIHATEDSTFSGWLNLMFTYDINTYNINQSYVVHACIEKNQQLRIRRPNRKVPRRAIWSEGQYQSVSFTSEIVISLEKVIINLLPQKLVKKRLWSKKYPIYVEFPKPFEEYHIEKSTFEAMNSKSTYFYLFGRTCREKEEWFRRLWYSSNIMSIDLNMWNIVQNYLTRSRSSLDETTNINMTSRLYDTSSRKSFNHIQADDNSRKVTYHNIMKEDFENQEPSVETHKWKEENKIPKLAEYVKYMAKFMPSDLFLLTSEVMRLDINYVSCNAEILCINAFLGRLFWDFLRGSHWVEIIRNKIQCKLKKMHLPQFIDQLSIIGIQLGKEIPLIRKFNRPFLDSRGLWCDAEIAYAGGFSMMIETKINLFNLRNQLKKSVAEESSGKSGSPESNSEVSKDEDLKSGFHNFGSFVDKTAAFVASEEDSAESSSDSDDSGDERQSNSSLSNPTQVGGSSSGSGSSKRIIRWVDKIARSSYFIKAADNKYIQRGMEIVSNTKLMLQVEVHSISGTLALNIPPPPSDRLWFGFRPVPILKMSAKPKVGQKEISISKITELIEKKLILEFQRVLVLPNMDDIPLPLLVNGNSETYGSNL